MKILSINFYNINVLKISITVQFRWKPYETREHEQGVCIKETTLSNQQLHYLPIEKPSNQKNTKIIPTCLFKIKICQESFLIIPFSNIK